MMNIEFPAWFHTQTPLGLRQEVQIVLFDDTLVKSFLKVFFLHFDV